MLSEFESNILMRMYEKQQEMGETLVRIEGRLETIETDRSDRANRQKVVVGALASVIATAVSGLIGVMR